MDEIVKLIETLRSNDGCPWDRGQTIQSLKRNLKEEFRELTEAINKEDHENVKEEIGDLIWTLLLMVQIAREEKLFDAGDVLKYTRDKIIRRHPHVFGKNGRQTTWRNRKKSSTCFRAETPEDAIRIFNREKEKENGLQKHKESPRKE